MPGRTLATLSVGAPLRLTRNVDFAQDDVAPLYGDILLGYAFAGPLRLRHGLGLGVSLNLSAEGGYVEPVGAASQLLVMPSYLLFYDASLDVVALGHVGLPFLLTGDFSAGVELAAGLAYKLTAGLGLYGELGADLFVGAESQVHPTVSAELGLLIDYEMLP